MPWEQDRLRPSNHAPSFTMISTVLMACKVFRPSGPRGARPRFWSFSVIDGCKMIFQCCGMSDIVQVHAITANIYAMSWMTACCGPRSSNACCRNAKSLVIARFSCTLCRDDADWRDLRDPEGFVLCFCSNMLEPRNSLRYFWPNWKKAIKSSTLPSCTNCRLQ